LYHFYPEKKKKSQSAVYLGTKRKGQYCLLPTEAKSPRYPLHQGKKKKRGYQVSTQRRGNTHARNYGVVVQGKADQLFVEKKLQPRKKEKNSFFPWGKKGGDPPDNFPAGKGGKEVHERKKGGSRSRAKGSHTERIEETLSQKKKKKSN